MSTTPTAEQPRLTTSLPSQYAPADVEGPLYERWVERGYFTADAASDKPAYCIVIPPPNVTGSLHLGHAFQHTLMDALTRRRRMQGYETLWLPGMDHAGIATQTLVERQLAETEGKSKHDYTREEFVAKVWQWKAEYGGKILGQMRRLGDGVDWTPERFTMDEGLSRAVRTIFARMHPDGDRYRDLIGTTVELPLTGRRIPVVADEHVDPEFGTGAVKVTPAHDPNDFEIGRRHDLPMVDIFDEGGVIVDSGTRFD